MISTLEPDCEMLITLVLPVVLDDCVRCALALKSTIGNNAAPTMRAFASAWTLRATAAAISRLAAQAASMISVNSRDRKARHQSRGGSAASAAPGLRGPAL